VISKATFKYSGSLSTDIVLAAPLQEQSIKCFISSFKGFSR